jgi:hypothetical protein
MVRLCVFGLSVGVLLLALAFVGVGVMMRWAIAGASYDPILDDGYAGTIDEFNAGLMRRIVVASVIATASGGVAFFARPGKMRK